MVLIVSVATVFTGPAAIDLGTLGITLVSGVFYGVRIHVENVTLPSAGTRVRVYLDNDELIDHLFTEVGRQTKGNIGFTHGIGSTVVADEVELFQLPLESDIVELNAKL